MLLSKYTIKNSNLQQVIIPDDAIFELPEKVLQFGTGALLRGLPDYFIDKANRMGLFNGRIVVVKSTQQGDISLFDKQDCLYTLCIRGIEHGKKTEENIICSAISRVLSAKQEWDSVLECAHNPQMQIIISNTTEQGIQLEQDDIRKHPPLSFPGKLLAFLYERYNAFDGSEQSGMIIIPTELIYNNAKKLEAIVLELAHLNSLDEKFIEWLEQCNHFCNSLVDRIVPGNPDVETKNEIEKLIRAKDNLITVAETYKLWAIECNEKAASVLSFANADEGVVLTNNLELFRELKLRLLNGTHTLMCSVAFLYGKETVKAAMDDQLLSTFIKELLLNELVESLPENIDDTLAHDFAVSVMERFSNPYIHHYWHNISANLTQKMSVRVIPLFIKYIEKFHLVPDKFTTCFAAYLLFMKPSKSEKGMYYGNYNGTEYTINDSSAAFFNTVWKNNDIKHVVHSVLINTSLWHTDLTLYGNFEQELVDKLQMIVNKGFVDAFQEKKEVFLAI